MVRISSSRIDLEQGRIDQAVIKDYGETLVGGATGASSTSTYTVDLDNGNVFHVVLTANCTFTFSNPTTSGTSHSFILYLRQDTTGSRTATWPASLIWPSGTAPTLTTTPTHTDIFSFTTTDGGTTWLGFTGALDFSQPSAIDAITSLGLTSNLQLCLDAGDSNSYSSGQSWLDLSGNGYDFFRGETSGSSTDDPTFNGTAGNLSSAEYWSFDGGDHFTYDTTNETWMENLHKDNTQFTLLVWAYLISSATADGIFSTGDSNSSNIGMNIAKQNNDNFILDVKNGSGTNALFRNGDTITTFSQWALYGISVDEGGGSVSFFTVNGAYHQSGGSDTWNASYTSPSASSATFPARIGSRGTANKLGSGSRVAMFCAWEGTTLSIGEINSFYQATRNRFGV